MGQLNLKIATRRDDATLKAAFETPGTIAKHSILQKIVNFLSSIQGGSELGPSGAAPSIAVSVEGQAVAASQTYTLDTVVATDAIAINGVSFVAVVSNPSTNEFVVGADDGETADNLAAAINASASALIDGYVTAEVTDYSPVVVTVSAAEPGIMGNSITTTSADATITVGGARLEGGLADGYGITLSF